jgi:hypothetical protein
MGVHVYNRWKGGETLLFPHVFLWARDHLPCAAVLLTSGTSIKKKLPVQIAQPAVPVVYLRRTSETCTTNNTARQSRGVVGKFRSKDQR